MAPHLAPKAARRERLLVAAAFAVLALLRLATLAPDPWEWDEVLFMEGVRDGLDVRLNHPHPPGYPVFIRLGQGIRALGVEPFRATALAGALGGFVSAVALYLLVRELGARRAWALAGSMIYALTPSVWLHGVRPLSDGPGAAAAIFSAVFLVRAIAGGSGQSLVFAAVFAALAAGVRPQVGLALLPAAAVAAFCVWKRSGSVKPLGLAFLAGALLSAAVWLPVFRSSGGFSTWKECLKGQMQWVTTHDSPKALDLARPTFWSRWFLDPVGNDAAAAALLGLALAGAAAAPRKTGLVLLVLAPVAVLTLGVLSTDSAPRYVLAFWAAPCALAALALERLERVRGGRVAAPAAALVLLSAFVALGAPPIVEVATKESPSVALMRAAVATGVPAERVLATEPLRVHVHEFFGPGARVVSELVPLAVGEGGVFLAADDRPFGVVPVRTYTLDHPRLPRLTRGRYLRTEGFLGSAGAGVFVPSVTPPGWQLRGRVELPEGSTLTVRAAGEADVAFSARAAGDAAAIEVVPGTGAEVRAPALSPDREETVRFRAAPDAVERLFVARSVRGTAVLDSFRILATDRARRPPFRQDDAIPASIDDPAEGARVTLPLAVRGWCQERGGSPVEPVEFRVDGVLVTGVSVTRSPRPEVADALPEIGDASSAGWEALVLTDAPPGRHTLTVTFQAGDRRRVYPPRAFEVEERPAAR